MTHAAQQVAGNACLGFRLHACSLKSEGADALQGGGAAHAVCNSADGAVGDLHQGLWRPGAAALVGSVLREHRCVRL